MKSLLPIAASCLLAGGAIGYIFGNSGSETTVNEGEQDKKVSRLPASKRSVTNSGSSSGEAGGGSKKPQTYEEVAATPGQTARLQALVDLYSGLSSEEFAIEVEKLNGLPMGERMMAGYILFGAWAEVSPYDALDHSRTMGMAGGFVRPTILQSWASTDPKGAAAYFESNKSEFAMMGMMGRGRDGGSSGAATIAGEWAKQDPDGALAWAKSLDGSDSEQATAKVISQIASTDPERAAGLTMGLEGEALAKANSNIAGEWAKSDWGKTEAFINGLPADQQGDALGAAVRSLASEDPRLAGTKALEIPEGDARNQAVESVAESMARSNPAEAAKWIVENGNEVSQKEAMRDIMGNWVGQDANAAKNWAVAQPEGALRDAAVSSYVMNDSAGSPQENIQLAESISDEGSRGRAIGMTAIRWMGEDKEAATQYIQSSEIVDDRAKEWILGGGGRRGR